MGPSRDRDCRASEHSEIGDTFTDPQDVWYMLKIGEDAQVAHIIQTTAPCCGGAPRAPTFSECAQQQSCLFSVDQQDVTIQYTLNPGQISSDKAST
jgi:hypothetical protein